MSTLLVSTVKDPAGGSTITVPTSGTFTLGSGWSFISSVTPSTASEAVFTSGIDATYDSYVFVCNDIRASNDGVEFGIQVSTDGGSGYISSSVYSTNEGSAEATVNFTVSPASLGNASGEAFAGVIYMHSPASTNLFTLFTYATAVTTTGGVVGGSLTGSGYLATTAVNAIRFFPSAGTITGTIRMYGVNKT